MRFFNLKKRKCGNIIKYNEHRCSVIEVNTRSAHLFDKGISFSLGVM